ncbi:MAG: LON peptidase substrate-binding domain-containing protein, partial [Rhodospirillales bacterium]|nr:LON peptidase substrate-binding domain-containing protein [Rhodospirillales bacterium]
SQPIPLFPLADCVVLPHATVPLHIFEQRYRAMTHDALNENHVMAMATFDGDEWKKNYQGNPPLRPWVCVGAIVRHAELPDGRFNILLQGITRARIVEELPNELYRTALLDPIDSENAMEIDLQDHRERIEELFEDPALKRLAAVNAIKNWLNNEIPTAIMVDLAALTLCRNVEARYSVLAQPDAWERATWLESHLIETRKVLRLAERLEPGMDEDGNPIN